MEIPETVRSTDDVTLQIYDLGGSGPLLLLCHATGFCGRVWEPAAESLSEHYRCITFDFRAHGNSTRPVDRPMVWAGMGEDVLAVAGAISPNEPIAAVGHSMGGTTLILAEDMRPGTFSKAWTFEPILLEGDTAAGEQADPSEISTGARRRRAVFDSRDEVYERYSSRPPLSSLDPRALRAYVDHGFRDLPDGTVTLSCQPEDEAGVFEYHNSGARSIIGSMTIPFLVAASGDGGFPAVSTVEAAAEFENLELAKYDNLTHFGPLEDPDGIAADVAAWLSNDDGPV